MRLHIRLASAAHGTVLLDDGTELAAGTLVWAAGVRPSPLGVAAGLPADKAGRIQVGADLAVTGVPGVFAAGDIAAVPDLSRPGEFCAPNAQHAVRQSKVLARNIVAFGRGGQLKPYRHAYVGSVAGLGHHQGVAQVYRIRHARPVLPPRDRPAHLPGAPRRRLPRCPPRLSRLPPSFQIGSRASGGAGPGETA